MKKTNYKEYINQVNAYIYDSLEKDLSYFWKCFEVEYNHDYNKRQYPILQDRIASYLAGLPSCINIAFTYAEIIKLAEKWHDCKLTDSQAEMVCDKWFDHIAYFILKLSNRHV